MICDGYEAPSINGNAVKRAHEPPDEESEQYEVDAKEDGLSEVASSWHTRGDRT
jgi:hypothetical protein